MQNLNTLSNSTLVSIWYAHDINPNNDVGIQRFSHVVIPIKYQYLTGIMILMQVG